jgi:hypothetical protein
MKTTRLATRPQPQARPIKSFAPPAGPKVDPMSMGAPKRADQLTSGGKPLASHPGEIDPRQQRY